MNEIYLIRHAKSEANKNHVFGTDAPLSFEGEAQIIKARQRYENMSFDKIYSSTRQRAWKTATLLFHSPIPEDCKLKDFDEIWFGNVEGRADTRTGIEGYTNQYQDDFIAFMKECNGDNPYERADIAIAKLQSMADEMVDFPMVYSNKRIAIVTSDTLMRCIIQTLRYGHDWNRISEVKHIDNLDNLRFSYIEDTIIDNTLETVDLNGLGGTSNLWMR